MKEIEMLQLRPYGTFIGKFKEHLCFHLRFREGSYFGCNYGLLALTPEGRFIDVWIDVYDNLWTIYCGTLVRLDDGAFTIIEEFHKR